MSLVEFKRYIKIYVVGIKTSLEKDMEYKTDFYISLIQLIVRLTFSIIFIEVLYLKVTEINGWTKYDLWMLYGIFGLSTTIFDTIFYGLKEVGWKIKDGDLDTYLTKPVNLIFALIFENHFIYYITDFLVNLAVITYALLGGASINLGVIFIGIPLFIALDFAISLFFQSINFFTPIPQTGRNLASNIVDFGKTPANFFNQGIQIFLNFVFPLFLISGVAFGIEKGTYPTSILIPVSIVVMCIYILSIKFWKLGLSKYSSASS